MTSEQILTRDDLGQFIGSEQLFRHGLSRKHLYAQGAQFVAERAGAYWLLDKIALHGSTAIAREEFQLGDLAERAGWCDFANDHVARGHGDSL